MFDFHKWLCLDEVNFIREAIVCVVDLRIHEVAWLSQKIFIWKISIIKEIMQYVLCLCNFQVLLINSCTVSNLMDKNTDFVLNSSDND